MAAHSPGPVPHLKALAVPVDELQCAEYCFYVVIDFTRKLKEDPGVTNLKQILTGLLNTSGGIIELRSHDSEAPNVKVLDKWKNSLVDALKSFIPHNVYSSCIRLYDSYPYQMCVKKSDVLITTETHMYVRGLAGNEIVRDRHSISSIMTRLSETAISDPFAGESSVTYNTKTHVAESENVELKCWNSVRVFDDVTNKDTYKIQLQEERMERTFLALPNMPSGGYAIIGISEKSYVACGQIIKEDDEKRVRSAITDFVKRSSSGSALAPICDVKFIPVTGGPSGERRRLIVISLNVVINSRNPFHNTDSILYDSHTDVWNYKDVVLRYWPTTETYADGTENSYKTHLHSREVKHQLSRLLKLSSGGHMVIGIEERDENMIVGQVVTAMEEIQIKSFVSEFLKRDQAGRPRVWGDERKCLTEGSDWSIRFIPVTGGPPGERRRVIMIGFKHFPGGVWMRYPETFLVNEEGFIEECSFEEWIKSMQLAEDSPGHQSMLPLQCLNKRPNISPANPIPVLAKSPHQKPKYAFGGNSSVGEPQTDTHKVETVTALTKRFYVNRNNLSYTRHKIDWRHNLNDTSVDLDHNVHQLADSSIFAFEHPVTMTPGKGTLMSVHREQKRNMKQFVDALETPIESFAIAVSNWSANVKCKIPKPKHHVLDVFKVDRAGGITLWVLFEKFESESCDNWTYTLLTGRTTKRRILFSRIGVTTFPVSSMWVECHMCDLEGSYVRTMTLPVICDWLKLGESQIRQFKLSLAALLLQTDTRIKTIFGDELSIKFTAMQMEAILYTDLERFVFIEGPPGSGKTYMALYLYQRYPNYLYICTTKTFKQFLLHEGLDPQRILVADSSETFNTQIDEINWHSVNCVIFDDFQNTSFGFELWFKLFKAIAKCKHAHLFVFGDSRYQHFENTIEANEVASYMVHFCTMNHFHFTVKHLLEIHRNTRKIASFIQSSFDSLEFPEMERLKCSRAEDGDDVEIQYLPNILSFGAPNSLVEFVKHLSDPRKTVKNEISSYEPKDVAILLDRPDEDIVKCRQTFANQIADEADIHDAGTFPVTGYTIDKLKNFLGMDRKVCVVITNDEVVNLENRTGHSLTNPQYKTFAASRGITRVVFVVETQLTAGLAATLGLDKAPECDAKMLWHLEPAEPVIDLCMVDLASTNFVLYITSSSMFAVGLDGKDVNFMCKIGDPNVGSLVCVASDSKGRYITVAGLNSMSEERHTIAVYDHNVGVSSNDVLELNVDRRYHIEDGPLSMKVTDTDILIVLTWKSIFGVRLRTGSIRPSIQWKISEGIQSPQRLAVSGVCVLYVSDQGCIHEMTERGLEKNIKTYGLSDPGALCVDSTGSCLFLCERGSRDVYRMNTDGSRSRQVLRVPGKINQLHLHADRFLGVAMLNFGLVMYDIRPLILYDIERK